MLKAIFFDFDGTLAEDENGIRIALSEACRTLGERWSELNPEELAVSYRQFSEVAWSNYDHYLRPLVSPEAMLASIWRHTLASKGIHDPRSERDASEIYWQHRLQHCRLYDDVTPLLQELAQQFPLCLLTNGAPSMQRAKVAASGITPFFQHVFVGGDFSRGKPDAQIFHAALTATQCQPEEAIHIGDSLVHDIAGARGVGVRSVWLNRKDKRWQDVLNDKRTGPDFTITTLMELVECLEELSQNK